MKRKLAIIIALAAVAVGVNSCEELGDCKVCRQVTYVDGIYDHEGNASEYCGLELARIEAEEDMVYLNVRTTWECD
jgi:hypothetical protein